MRSSDTPSRPASLSLRKKTLFALLTTIAFFALVECLLTLFGFAVVTDTTDPFVGFSRQIPLLERVTDDGGQTQLRTAANKLVWFNDQQFPLAKAPRTKRVFCMGGSTTFGRPYADSTSFCGWLRELLPLADDATDWEVINAGGVSYASYRVAAVMEELASYEPDLFIVYTGQNEFLERRTYAGMFDQSALKLNVTAALSRTRTWSLINNAFKNDHAKSSPTETLPGEVDEMLNHTIGPLDYHRDDQWHAKVLQHYRFNLQRMIAIARRSGAEIVFIVPASNEKDCSPFKSETDSDRYQKARRLFDAGSVDEASVLFKQSIDEDICPLRVPTDFIAALKEIAESNDVALVDFQSQLRNLCRQQHGHSILGDEYFLDHVHPTIETHRQLALWIIAALQSKSLIGGKVIDQEAIDAAGDRVLRRLDPIAQGVALRNLAKVLHWAGKFDEAEPRARDALQILVNDSESILVLADCLRHTNRIDEAVAQYERLSITAPMYVRGYLPYAELLIELEDYKKARDYLAMAVIGLADESAEQTRANYFLAVVHVKLSEFELAVPMLEQIDEQYPHHADTLFYLAQAKAGLNDSTRAMELYQELLRINPDDGETHNNLGMLLLKEKRPGEALRHFESALRIDPDNANAKSYQQITKQLLP